MPMISERQVAALQAGIQRQQDRLARAKKKAEEKAGEMKQTLEIVGGASALGFVRGKMEDAGGAWNIPGTTIDMELAVGLAVVGAGYFDLFGKYDEDVLNLGNGILAHYLGQVFRKFGKTGQFSMVAGVDPASFIGASSLSNALNYSGV